MDRRPIRLLLLLVLFVHPLSSRVHATPEASDPVADRIRTLVDQREYAAVLDTIPPLIARARERGDSLQLGRLVCARGQSEFGTGDPVRGLRSLRVAERIGIAVADTLTILTARGVTMLLLNQQGRYEEGIALADSQLVLARASGYRAGEGFAYLGKAFAHLNLGHAREAKASYTEAIRLFEGMQDGYWQRTAMIGYGRALSIGGEIDEARDTYETVRALASEAGDAWNEAVAINNLGVIEYNHGDLDAAARNYETAYRIKMSLPSPIFSIAEVSNVAHIRMLLGDFEAAAALVEDARRQSREAGLTPFYVAATCELGNVRLAQGRLRDATRLYRESLAAPLTHEVSAEAALGLTLALLRSDSAGAAVDVARGSVARLEEGELWFRLQLEILEARALRRVGRTAEAIDVCERAVAASEGQARHADACLELAVCYTDRERYADAQRLLLRAMDAFERRRDITSSSEWREIIGEESHPAMVDVVATLLTAGDSPISGRDPAHAFDLLQRAKARTLLERLSSPVRGDTIVAIEPLPAGTVQETLLRPGDLLLDFHAGDEYTLLFAVTVDSMRAIVLPGQRSPFAARLLLLCESLGDGGAAAAHHPPPLSAQREIGDRLLGGVADLCRSSDRIIVSPDGYLSGVPLGVFALDGADTPLAGALDVVQVPAASVLDRDGGDGAGRRGIVALAPDGTLAGAKDEVGYLRDAFSPVASVSGYDDDLAAALAGFEVIHVAAHVDVDDTRPWHSGIRLAADTSGAPSHLRAAQILREHFDARLAVLAACESGLGRISRGEGVLGLSTSFLIAGVPAVVGTLWRVDDGATRELMGMFYEGLAAGETVSAALRAAQARMRSRQATSHPYYWAGFVVIGDGDVTVDLQRKRFSGSMLLVLLAIGAVAAGAILLRNRIRM